MDTLFIKEDYRLYNMTLLPVRAEDKIKIVKIVFQELQTKLRGSVSNKLYYIAFQRKSSNMRYFFSFHLYFNFTNLHSKQSANNFTKGNVG